MGSLVLAWMNIFSLKEHFSLVSMKCISLQSLSGAVQTAVGMPAELSLFLSYLLKQYLMW